MQYFHELGIQESNLYRQNQNLLRYHYANPQCSVFFYYIEWPSTLWFDTLIHIPSWMKVYVGVVGIEPTQPHGNGFTVRPDSPTSAHSHECSPQRVNQLPREPLVLEHYSLKKSPQQTPILTQKMVNEACAYGEGFEPTSSGFGDQCSAD